MAKKSQPKAKKMKAIKGFDSNLQCRGHQFEVGQTYTYEGDVMPCESGFHAIPEDQHPLAVFEYYPPAGARFAIVEVSGKIVAEGDKIAAQILRVEREIGIGDLAQEAVKWVLDRAKGEGPVAVDNNGLATASGARGAATASGYQGAATASGYQGAATASGYQGAATASGARGAATASGDQGAATASGDQGANAMTTGIDGKVCGVDGAGLYAVERAAWDGPIVSNACGIVGQNGIKPMVWYRCVGGKLVEATE